MGTLGGEGSFHGSEEEIQDLISFDGGYLANQRIVGSQGQWASRLWFSGNGRDWQVVESFDEEDLIVSMASNGSDVVMFVETLEYAPAAWTSSDGTSWEVNENIDPDAPGDPAAARALWTQPDGWYGAFLESYEGCDGPYGCFRGALWESADGLGWQRLNVIDDGDPSAGVTAADGSILVFADYLMRTRNEGASWRRVREPRNCFDGYEPRFLADSRSTDLMIIFGGGEHVCMADAALQDWWRISLPTSSILESFRTTLADTRFGIMAAAPSDCFETQCPPVVEHFLSPDGDSWLALEGLNSDLSDAIAATFTDGPNGVFALASYSSAVGRYIRIFELVEQ
jgi:hypothetical protein